MAEAEATVHPTGMWSHKREATNIGREGKKSSGFCFHPLAKPERKPEAPRRLKTEGRQGQLP